MEEYGRGGRGHETRSNLPSSSINQFPLSRIRRKRLHLSSTLLGPQFAFCPSESERAANSQGERAAAFPYSHSRGVGPRKHYFVIIARKAICASLPACLRSFVVKVSFPVFDSFCYFRPIGPLPSGSTSQILFYHNSSSLSSSLSPTKREKSGKITER